MMRSLASLLRSSSRRFFSSLALVYLESEWTQQIKVEGREGQHNQ